MAANSLLICRFYTGFPPLQQTQTVKRARVVRFTQKDDKVIHVPLALNYFLATLEFQRFESQKLASVFFRINTFYNLV